MWRSSQVSGAGLYDSVANVEVGDKDKLASAVSLVWQVDTLTDADVC